MIPRQIYQTHKSLEYINSKDSLINATATWKNYCPEFNYNFYSDSMCKKFIEDNFDENIINAYNRCPMAVMKADLWRYCIIYTYGGIYADTDTLCLVNPDIFVNTNAKLVFAPENDTGFFCQWFFAAPKNSPVLKEVIDLSVKRILEIKEIKGEHIIHYLTGPAMFTDAIELYLKKNNLPIFNKKKEYANYSNDILKVFEPINFHINIIRHLFTGNDEDGWKKERAKFLF
jgi:mannosyltransferase OCH1-like enzyme